MTWPNGPMTFLRRKTPWFQPAAIRSLFSSPGISSCSKKTKSDASSRCSTKQRRAMALGGGKMVGVTEAVKPPAGEFKNCVKTKETTPLEPDVGSKHYAPGIGLVQDAGLVLVRRGTAEPGKK